MNKYLRILLLCFVWLPTFFPCAADSEEKNYEIVFWESIKDSQDPKLFELYLEKFPNGVFTGIARHSIEKLGDKGQTSSPAPSTRTQRTIFYTAPPPIAAPPGKTQKSVTYPLSEQEVLKTAQEVKEKPQIEPPLQAELQIQPPPSAHKIVEERPPSPPPRKKPEPSRKKTAPSKAAEPKAKVEKDVQPSSVPAERQSAAPQQTVHFPLKVALFPFRLLDDADIMTSILTNDIINVIAEERCLQLSHSYYQLDKKHNIKEISNKESFAYEPFLKSLGLKDDNMWNGSTPNAVTISTIGNEIGADAVVIGSIRITNPWSDRYQLGYIHVFFVDINSKKIFKAQNKSSIEDARDILHGIIRDAANQYSQEFCNQEAVRE